MKTIVRLAALSTLLMIPACTTGITIKSNADITYTKAIHKLFVLAELPFSSDGRMLLYKRGESTLVNQTDPVRNEVVIQIFKNKLTAEAGKLGITIACEIPTGLELDPGVWEKKTAAFAPDAVLMFDCVSILLSSNKEILSSSYNVSLYDYATNKRVWRATMSVMMSLNSIYSDGFAQDILKAIVDQLKKDNMNVLGTLEPVN
jgi:hypothetical protein